MDARWNARWNENTAALRQLSIQTARNANRSLLADETITPVPNNVGDLPPADDFPQLQLHIGLMTAERVNRLLAFYGIVPQGPPNLNRKKALLCSHLGLKRLSDAF
jgi:hypothetical protein